MATSKANKEKIVYEMVLEIEAGKTYSETLVVNGSKWKLASTTFSRYWKQAQEDYNKLLEQRKQSFIDKTTKANEKAVERAIMTKEQKLEILESIITSTATFPSGKFVEILVDDDKGGKKKVHQMLYSKPYSKEILQAIDIHNKMQGDNKQPEGGVNNNNFIINGKGGGVGLHSDLSPDLENELDRFVDAIERHKNAVYTPDTSEQTT